MQNQRNWDPTVPTVPPFSPESAVPPPFETETTTSAETSGEAAVAEAQAGASCRGDHEASGEAEVASYPPSTSSHRFAPSGYLKKKHEEKFRKKDPLSWENVAKNISSLSDGDKIRVLGSKYQDLYNEHRKVSVGFLALSKEYNNLEKDKHARQAEMAKLVIAKARLESIGRELQKQNRQIKEENIAKIKEEEERRKEISSKFSDKLSDINQMMDENKEMSEKLREENVKMTAKLADLYGQFQQREDDISKMSQQLELEREFSKATLAKMELEFKAEREINNKEQLTLKNNLEKSESNCAILIETVKGLQDNIEVYKRQYEDFEATMSKSAKVFDNFKTEISTMNKQLAALDHEAQTYKNKYHDSMRALLETTEIKKNQDYFIQGLHRKNDQLQKLCRQLQTDRSFFLKLLKTNHIEPSAPPEELLDEARKPDSPKTQKELELELIKENLQVVQDELSKLQVEGKTDNTTSQTAAPEEAKNTPDDESAKGACALAYEVSGDGKQPESKAHSPEPASKKMVLLDQDRGVHEEVEMMKVHEPKKEEQK